MSSKVRLLLIRHGETDHNAGQLALGQFDVPLNERGRRQAQALAEALGSDDIAAVYSSPLQRAVATATPLADALGLEVQIEPGLIEMDVGETDGVPFSDLRERYPDFLRDWMSDRVADVRMPGGECLREVQERSWSTIEAVRGRWPEETVAMVSHNFVILTALCSVLELPLAGFRRLRHELAAVSIASLNAARRTLPVLHDTAHLRAPGLGCRRLS